MREKRSGVSATLTPIHSPSLFCFILYFTLILQFNPAFALNSSHSFNAPTNTGVNSSSPVGFKHITTYSVIEIYLNVHNLLL